MDNNNLGKAGELRVASELLLRDLTPLLSMVDTGTDITLTNGVRLQVKTARLGCEEGRLRYSFNFHQHFLKDGRRKYRPHVLLVDFIVLWTVDDDKFYVVPVEVIRGKVQIRLYPNDRRKGFSLIYEYEDAWRLLAK